MTSLLLSLGMLLSRRGGCARGSRPGGNGRAVARQCCWRDSRAAEDHCPSALPEGREYDCHQAIRVSSVIAGCTQVRLERSENGRFAFAGQQRRGRQKAAFQAAQPSAFGGGSVAVQPPAECVGEICGEAAGTGGQHRECEAVGACFTLTLFVEQIVTGHGLPLQQCLLSEASCASVLSGSAPRYQASGYLIRHLVRVRVAVEDLISPMPDDAPVQPVSLAYVCPQCFDAVVQIARLRTGLEFVVFVKQFEYLAAQLGEPGICPGEQRRISVTAGGSK